MTELSRFFDHIDGDRTYNATDFAEYFRTILTTGVLDTGVNLQVYVSGTDRIARIKPGKAWVEGYFYKLTEKLELPLEEAHGTYDRIDRIVLRLDTNTEARNIKAFVKTGELSLTPEPPTLIRDGNIYEISLAQILIVHNTTAIPVGNVTDERLDSEACGLANMALTYEEFALKVDTGDINGDTLPVELKGKPLTEQILYAIEQGGKVKSVNGKTGKVVIDVGDISKLNTDKLALCSGSSATNTGAIAIGDNAKALHQITIALGRNATASNNLGAVAIGNNATSLNNSEGILGGPADDPFSTRSWIVPGAFTVNGTKNFEIPHPRPSKRATHRIRHGAVESPTPGDTLYRYKVQANKDDDLVVIDLPDYFIWLNKNVQVFVTPQGHFGNGYGILNRETEQLQIHCQFAGEYNVLVIGTRNDDHQSVQDWNIKGVEREIGESWTGETYVFEVDEIMEVEEIKEVI